MNDSGANIVIAFLVIVVFMFIGLSIFNQNQRNELIKSCEAELSRNQHCKLIAVPLEN